jgi:hypothetical protein
MGRKQRNPRERIVIPTFAYAEVETALAKIFDAEDVQREVFRACLKNFRRLGIPAETPGKGSRLRYSVSDLCQLLIALELTAFGLPPDLVVKTLRRDWSLRAGFFDAIQSATQPDAPSVFVVMAIDVLGARLGRRGMVETGEGFSLRSEPNPITVKFTWNAEDLIHLIKAPGARLSVFNLSDRIRAVRKALAI